MVPVGSAPFREQQALQRPDRLSQSLAAQKPGMTAVNSECARMEFTGPG